MLTSPGSRAPRLPFGRPEQISPVRQQVVAARRNDQGTDVPVLPTAVINLTAGMLVLVAGSAVCARPAQAFGIKEGQQEWTPRRHYRSMKEQRSSPKFERLLKRRKDQVPDSLGEAIKPEEQTYLDAKESVAQKIFSNQEAEQGFVMRDRPSWQRSYDAVRDRYHSTTARVKQRLVAAYPTPIYIEADSQRQAEKNWPWIIGIPTSFLAVMLIAFSGNIKAFFLGNIKRGEKRGRWVRDRSLGGKMVFVSFDEDLPPRPRSRSSRSSPLEDVDEADVSSEMAREARMEAAEARLCRIVETFPMPEDAPEAALVGSALRDRFNSSEMENLLKTLAVMDVEHKALFATLLGFDLELTMPMLEQYVRDKGVTDSDD